MLTKLSLLLCLVLASPEAARAFSLGGPLTPPGGADNYQTAEIGYNMQPGPWGEDRCTPKAFDQEYRWNTPVLYYTSDSSFINYFGSNGLAAVDQAMLILNSLTNLSAYSADLHEFPLESLRVNYRAREANLRDLKTSVLTEMVEELGLAQPDRWNWCLRYRDVLPGGTCPEMQYTVIKRNYDPVTWLESSYVNGTLYTYYIWEVCDSFDVYPNADAVELPVDPLAPTRTAIASFGGLGIGRFATGLTRDDVGGLRYMWVTNNVNLEIPASDGETYVTNTYAEPLYTTNLQFLSEAALTNTAAALQALFPGLIVTGSSNYLVNVIQTNVTLYYTNYTWDWFGTPPRPVYATNYTTTVENRYLHTFGNVFTNEFFPYAVESVLKTNIISNGQGTSITNLETVTYTNTDTISGSFYLLPTNACEVDILGPQLTNVLSYTNFLTNTFLTFTNSYTNSSGSNITLYSEYSESQIFYFTNVIYSARTITCPTNTPGLYEGMDRIHLVRRDYSSLLDRYWEPLTNIYTLNSIVGNEVVPRKFRRVMDRPDFLFAAGDPETGPNTGTEFSVFRPEPPFNTDQVLDPELEAGPGTIDPAGGTVRIYFNKVGSIRYNFYPDNLDQATALSRAAWGSFDDSTNAPTVYPDSLDLQSLENLLLIHVTQPSNVGSDGESLLPDAPVNVGYSFQLEGVGGVSPYTWELASGSAGLPNGLSLSVSGLISGTPTTPGKYDFAIRLTEGGGRHIDRPMSLTVLP